MQAIKDLNLTVVGDLLYDSSILQAARQEIGELRAIVQVDGDEFGCSFCFSCKTSPLGWFEERLKHFLY